MIVSDGNSHIVIAEQAAATVMSTPATHVVIAAGIQGPEGAPGGASSDSVLVYSFAWDDADEAAIATLSAGKTVFKIEVIIQTPFDVMPDSFSIGDGTNNARLMGNSDLDATEIGTYQANPGYRYLSDTQLNLYLATGPGTTAGTGLILIYL